MIVWGVARFIIIQLNDSDLLYIYIDVYILKVIMFQSLELISVANEKET